MQCISYIISVLTYIGKKGGNQSVNKNYDASGGLLSPAVTHPPEAGAKAGPPSEADLSFLAVDGGTSTRSTPSTL